MSNKQQTINTLDYEELLLSVRKVFGGTIDLDPTSSEVTNKVVRATTFYTKDNAFNEECWLGNTWMNPPQNKKLIKNYCDRLNSEYVTLGVENFITLTTTATDTEWFGRLYDVVDYYCFLYRKVNFIDHQGNLVKPSHSQVICYAGNNGKAFVNEFRKHGLIMKRQDVI